MYAKTSPVSVTNLSLCGFVVPGQLLNDIVCIRKAVRLLFCGTQGNPVKA